MEPLHAAPWPASCLQPMGAARNAGLRTRQAGCCRTREPVAPLHATHTPRATLTMRTPCLQCARNSASIMPRLLSSWWHVTAGGWGVDGWRRGWGCRRGRGTGAAVCSSVQHQAAARHGPGASTGTGARSTVHSAVQATTGATAPAPPHLTSYNVGLPRQPRAVCWPASPVRQHPLCCSIQLRVVCLVETRCRLRHILRRPLLPILLHLLRPLLLAILLHSLPWLICALLPAAGLPLLRRGGRGLAAPGLAPQGGDPHTKHSQPGARAKGTPVGAARHSARKQQHHRPALRNLSKPRPSSQKEYLLETSAGNTTDRPT